MNRIIIILTILFIGSCTSDNRSNAALNQDFFQDNNTIQLSLTPNTNIMVGDQMELKVSLNDIQDLFACSFEMVYDKEAMRVDSVLFDRSFGDTLQVASYLSDNLSSSFIVGLTNNNDVEGLSGSWDLVDVYLTAISSLSTQLELKNFLLFNNLGDTISYFQVNDPTLNINISP
jgi:hypothetical protein